ncbi:MAG: DUF4440 domain-containing protein [Pyrinomonadaceae bacterium]
MKPLRIVRSNFGVIVFTIFALTANEAFSQIGENVMRQTDERTIRHLEDELLSCYISGDKSKHDRIIADDFTGTDANAVIRSKTEDRTLLPAAPISGSSAVVEDVNVRNYGNFAVVTGRIVTKMRIGDKEIAGFKPRFTDTWLKLNGEWKVVARHYSRPPVEWTVAKIDPASFDEYHGKYELGPGVEFTLSKERSRLFAQLSGQPKRELLPESDLVFFTKDIPALFIFVRDRVGRISRLLTVQEGKVTSATNIP